MGRTMTIPAGFFALTLLIVFCIYINAPAIQDDIQTRTSVKLSSEFKDWVKVRANGRNIVLTGKAPSEKLRQKAFEMAGTVEGVVDVDNQVAVAKLSLGLPKTASVVSSSPNVLYNSKFTKKLSDVRLSGLVPSKESKEKLFSLAEKIFGIGHVKNQLKIGSGEPENWFQAASQGLTNLALLNEGFVELTYSKISMVGERLSDKEKQTIVNNLNHELPENFTTEFNLYESQAAEAVNQKEKVLQTNELSLFCKQKFNELVSTQRIHFSKNSAAIEIQTDLILDDLVQFVGICPNSVIEIAGHTDASGGDAYNYLLSKRRAQIVANRLMESGIQSNSLQIEGYGESRPLADNTTEKGQAENRRIELKYLREGEK